MRFAADTLDIARLPKPDAIRDLDYEAILAARLASLKTRFEAAGIPYNVEGLETEPGVILQQEDAYRELLDLGAINDAVRAVLVPLAVGSDLDHLAAFYGVQRMVVTPATETAPAVMEDDDRFRLRVLLAPEAFATTGSIGAYHFHALTADARVKDVGLRMPEPGNVEVAVLSAIGNGNPSEEILANVRERLRQRHIKPLTDVVSVVPAEIINFGISLTAYVLAGPDPNAVKMQIETAIAQLARDHHYVGRSIYRTAIIAAGHAGPVRRVALAQPANDRIAGPRQTFRLVSSTVTVETVHE